jgi:hypothetical protein
MLSKQVIWTLVGVHPTPLRNRLSREATGKPFPRTFPETSPSAAIINFSVMAFSIQSTGLGGKGRSRSHASMRSWEPAQFFSATRTTIASTIPHFSPRTGASGL